MIQCKICKRKVGHWVKNAEVFEMLANFEIQCYIVCEDCVAEASELLDK